MSLGDCREIDRQSLAFIIHEIILKYHKRICVAKCSQSGKANRLTYFRLTAIIVLVVSTMNFLLSASGWYSCKLETVPTPFRYLRQERKSTASPSGKAGDTMKIGFIGAGKVGFSLGKFFTQGGIRLTGFYSWRPESAREAASFTGAKAYESLIPGKMICHCSGSMTVAEAFPGISQTGAYGYSIHPLFPVSNRLTSYRELPGAFFCLEGNGPHLSMWQELLESLGASAQIISGESKVRYHAACAISSNLVCGLVQESLDLLETCGFSRETALRAITPLLRSNLEHIIESDPVSALTGPVERCDVRTVEKHLACFPNQEERDLYSAVSRKLVELASLKHPERDYQSLKNVLRKGENKNEP